MHANTVRKQILRHSSQNTDTLKSFTICTTINCLRSCSFLKQTNVFLPGGPDNEGLLVVINEEG